MTITRKQAVMDLEDYKRDHDLDIRDEAIDIAINALEQESILDKIKSEIEQNIDKEKLNFGGQFDRGLNLAIKIIDKYKSESER